MQRRNYEKQIKIKGQQEIVNVDDANKISKKRNKFAR